VTLRPEGSLLIDLRLAGGRVCEVRLSSQRPAEASRVLEGQPLGRALQTVPLLWSICANAHSVAALSAVEAALGVVLPAAQGGARQVLALAEAIDNHAWQLCLEWPRLAGGEPDAKRLKVVRALTAGLRAAVFGKTPWRVPGGVVLRPDQGAVRAAAASLEALLWELSGGDLPGSLEQVRARAPEETSVIQTLLALALAAAPSRSLPVQARLLPALPPAWFTARAAELALAVRPTWEGGPAETGALAQQQHHPLVAEALVSLGPCTATRLLARVCEVNALPAALRTLAEALTEAEPVRVDPAASGLGAGVVETSRGLLAHVVTLERGAVVRWRTVAPTEWNFHPEGPLVQALLGLPAEGLAQQAALAVAALDPCVGYQVQIGGDDGAA
jgi:coenzyme F420-reducing hydrogenase alpha subunit